MKIKAKLSVPQIIVLGFFILIAVVTLLLLLPFASAEGVSIHPVDALFTAVSAVCVTGLVVVNTSTYWSTFGLIVILTASQIGALGFMTFVTLIFLFTGKKITLKQRMLIQQTLNQRDLGGMVRLVQQVVVGTLLIESVAALLLSIRFTLVEGVSFGKGLWYGLFHAVCAFCSAGFDLLGDDSFSRYISDPMVNFLLMLLVTLGSLGYTVWIDGITAFRETRDKRRFFNRLSLQSRVVLEMTLVLTVFGALFFLICEFNNPKTIGNLSFPVKLLASLFQSVTPRTLGFYTISQQDLLYNSKLMTMVFMIIGGSPGSTCGGIKTVTFAVIAAAVYSVVKGRNSIVLHYKTISLDTLQKALAVVSVYLLVVLAATIALTFTEMKNPYPYELTDLLFESFSATGTVGLSTGITPFLSYFGKMVITLCMFVGRIGGITVALSLSANNAAANVIQHPEGKLIVG